MNDDVVIVGGGSAGLRAAIAAADGGRRVLVAEKGPEPGGSSAIAIGSIAAAGTRLQRRAGIADSPVAHLEDAIKFAEENGVAAEVISDNTSRLRLLAEGAAATVDWLESIGVSFSGPHPEPPHRVYRMHNVVPDATALVDALLRQAHARGVTIRTGARAVRLLQQGEAVTGVVLRDLKSDSEEQYRARAVILAAGDTSAAVGRQLAERPLSAPNALADGDGIAMATAVGALAYRPVPCPQLRAVRRPFYQPSRGLFASGAILVSSQGRRYADEFGDAVFPLHRLDPALSYAVFDAVAAGKLASSADDSPSARDGWWKTGKPHLGTFPAVGYAYLEDMQALGLVQSAATLRDLAAGIGVPVDALTDEVRVYNEMVASGCDHQFGRREVGEGIRQGPFYALGPFQPSITLADGGLLTDTEMRVMSRTGGPIPGLYAAGANGWGSCRLYGHGHHLAWALVSGLTAGTNAAQI